MTVNIIREKILELLYSVRRPKLSKAQLFFSTQTLPKDNKLFESAIANLTSSEIIIMDTKFSANPEYKLGYIQSFSKTEHYIFLGKKKYLVKNVENSIHGDKVIYKITDELLLNADVISVVKRKKESIVGTFVEYNGIGFVIPDKEKYSIDIYVIGDKPNQYDKVLIAIDEYKVFGKPEGTVVRKLEATTITESTPLEYVLDKYGISKEFPADVMKKAILLNVNVKKSMIDERVDLRDELIFTVDGKDSKDFDDAISVKRIGDNYEIGFYIADVSYYVEENGAIDKEAFKRGTSYYLDDTCIPMLPVSLSNGICSLNENVDRLCVGGKILLSPQGVTLNKELFECVINSKKRFTYEEINEYLNGEIDNLDHSATIELAIEVSQILKQKRQDRGNIDFNFNEIYVNEAGVSERIRGPANKMIEEFMILANETIAETIFEASHPFVYRIHDLPFSEKIEGLIKSCNELGIDTSMLDMDNITSKQFQALVESIPEKLKKCLNKGLITTMKQAKYSKILSTHFGLASNAYCHFTSPIRRYPDLFNHRIVKKYIRRRINNDDAKNYYEVTAEKVAKHCCFTERNANKAEEELLQIQIMEYMIEHPNESYPAFVYQKIKNGCFILLNNNLTGFIRGKDELNIGDETVVYFKEYEIKSGRLIFEPQEELK